MDVQGMRNAGLMDRPLQGLDDLTACHPVGGNDVVKRKTADVLLEGSDAAGVDDLDPERSRRLEDPGDVIADRGRAFSGAHEAEHEIVIAENGQDGLVDDRGVGEFEMGMQRMMRRDRRLDHGREAHLRIEPPRLESRPTDVGERRSGGPARMGAMLFGQHEARGVHVGAGDMRMDVDAAGHRDKAPRVHRLVGSCAAVRRRDDLIAANRKIADFVALVGGIDDMCALDADQHARRPHLRGKRR